eukprot:TRINITY_DN5872_c0_g1_i1.p1 TRINITY_DN5872_c0_g1~~TRINITY_DN5872_c0_g1_i1.p1  ORF type:complete len:673 (-),score=221.59 TRINITY_DN5872_c0_g1_i1:313-2331(-)
MGIFEHVGMVLAAAVVVLVVKKGREYIGSSQKSSFKDRFMYKIDHALSTNPEFKTYSLLGITIVLIIVGGITYKFARIFASFLDGEEDIPTFFESLAASWTFLLDNGAHLDESGVLPVLVSLALSIAGMLLDALLVGLVADALGEKMDDLKKGKSKVLEEGHTLILGWNDKLLPLIKELAIANESEGGGVVVVLADREKEAMEEEIQEQFSEEELKGTDIVCRSGNPMLVSELEKVSADQARSIVALAIEGDPDAADAMMVRVVLALCGGMQLAGHVVAEMRDIDNCDLVRIVGKNKVETVVSHDIIGRLMIQCARQRGLATTYERLLGFDGHEFYFSEFKHLVGKAFGEIGRWFPNAVPCGYKDAEGKIFLNPPADYCFQPGDELLAICEDDSVFNIASSPDPLFDEPDTASLPNWQPEEVGPEKILFCGWRRDLDDMITELDKCVSPGSELHILSTIPENERLTMLKEGGLEEQCKNLSLHHRQGSPVMRRVLEALDLESFSSILILAEQSEEAIDVTAADSRSMATLLLIRDIQAKRGIPSCTVISEITDPRTKQLIAVARISDYVVSNELVSMALAMISENREISTVLQELWTADGSEVFVRSARFYLAPGESLSFYQLARRVSTRQEVLLGYRRNGSTLGEVIINPDNKGEQIVWGEHDEFVVIAID